MERKYARYAIRNLMNYIVILYAVGMGMDILVPGFYSAYLSLDAGKIMHGQVWRIVTFLMDPPGGGSPYGGGITSYLLSNLLMIYLYFSIGKTLENVWGAFRFNVYFFMGVIGHVLAALVVYFIFGYSYRLTTTYLNASLFFAFAATFPDMQFLLYFVIPIKAKYMAIFNGIFFVFNFIFGSMADRISIGMAMANFILFFLMTRKYSRMNPREIKRKQEFKTKIKAATAANTHHKCAVCGRTEEDGDNLEFRFCSKCEGSYEYCQDHLYTHQHVTKNQ